MTNPALHSVSVAAIITNEAGEVLMIRRRDNGNLEPPGGVLELDESIYDGLKREVREETGLDIEPLRLTGVYKNLPRGVIALVFLARPIGGRILRSGPETISAEWIGLDQARTQCAEAFYSRIADALVGTEVAVRLHDGVTLLSDKPRTGSAS